MARLNTQPAQPKHLSARAASTSRNTLPTSPNSTRSSQHESGSDKENASLTRRQQISKGKRKSDAMAARSGANIGSSSNGQKRQRLSETQRVLPSQAARQREIDSRGDKKFYDPDQDEDERRATRKGMRNLYSRLNDSRVDYLRPDSKGLVTTLEEADELYKNVKQTSDATIDSRLLVAAADLSYKKINNMTLGDSSVGIDVDDFVTKCISFMRRGTDVDQDGQSQPSSTQTQRRRRREMEEDEDGNTMNWEHLGANACFLTNSRPCLSGFLLGPLQVQKKIRKQSQRRAREAPDPTQTARPITLTEEDMERQESASLTVVCSEIAQLLRKAESDGMTRFEAWHETQEEDVSDEVAQAMMRRCHIADNGCVPLFDFCVNPQSFGQTVENMFYVSFLIKEGKVGMAFDSNGFPTLAMGGQKSVSERQETQRNQAIFTLDFDVWTDIVQSFGIRRCIIPHRREEKHDDGTVDFVSREQEGHEEADEDEEND